MGHLIEMAEGSGLSAEISYTAVPILEVAKKYLAQRIVPDATYRNWNSYSTKTGFGQGVNVMEAFNVLPDPQTNGGLLIAAAPEALQEIQNILTENELKRFLTPIGKMVAKAEKTVLVNA